MSNLLPKHHILFTPENPQYDSKFAHNPSIEDVTKLLSQNGEDAQIIEGHYEQPERSILVSNPLNINGIHQLAQDFGQESVLHSLNGHHTLTFVNGPRAGQFIKGRGTNYFREKPEGDHSIIHTVDGPLYFIHNLDGEDVEKSEELYKAPIPYDLSSDDDVSPSSYTNINKVVHKEKDKKGFTHVVRVDPENSNDILHSLHAPGGSQIAQMHIRNELAAGVPGGRGYEPEPIVSHVVVSPFSKYRGKGYGKALYLKALQYHGNLTSDEAVSPMAHKVWKKLSRMKGVIAELAPYNEDDSTPHRATWVGKSEELYKADAQPSNKIREVADQYAHSKGMKLNHNLPPVKVNPQFASQVAKEYDKMPHTPSSPETKRSYDSLINETMDQFQHIKNSGLKISKIKPGMNNPYKSSKDLFHDVHNNNHIWYYPTESGFGPEGSDRSDHPMLRPTKELHDGKPMLANDVFRIVHDYFGHAKEGHGFGPNGEENAWQTHAQMFSPDARRAMTAETRGQNSFVNFGPHSEHNRTNPQQTVYADQKAGLLPDWTHEANPAMKSELEKGLRGDWTKEGYTFEHEPFGAVEGEAFNPEHHDFYIRVKDKKGNTAGYGSFVHEGARVYPAEVAIRSEHQRKGIGTHMYNMAQELSNKHVYPSAVHPDKNPEDMSDQAHRFWEKRWNTKRGMVGKSELEKGAARRLHGPFDPVKELAPEQAQRVASWVGGSGSDRKKLPDLSQAKLAASEKSDFTMEKLANLLEQKDDSEEIHMPEQLVNMWSSPRWNK